MTIERTVEVPASRRITLEVPPEIPAGKVILTFTPAAETRHERSREKIRLTKPMIDELLQGENLRYLTGLLHTEMSIGEIRAERLKKHDYTA
ncbi:MAG: hypothetical protein FWG35_00090 [Spirochaetaceae bacterium]|nr:hypothetical protein [Spirochaetaceae bacterium]